MENDLARLAAEAARRGDVPSHLAWIRATERTGDRAALAAALDRLHAIAPEEPEGAALRATVLEEFAFEAHGLRFRYVPEGHFLMGSEHGDPDERPVHRVSLAAYWIQETPMSWVDYCRLAGWQTVDQGGMPGPEELDREVRFALYYGATKLRLEYCGTSTGEATDRAMVAASWRDAEVVAEALSRTGPRRFRLPTEAEWERAARGGRRGGRYPRGEVVPPATTYDWDRWGDWELRPTKDFPPNDYGLYGMAGGVAEWTADWYDAQAYRRGDCHTPTGPPEGLERVLRGGSWADDPAACTVSFRSSRASCDWRNRTTKNPTPTTGFRLVAIAP